MHVGRQYEAIRDLYGRKLISEFWLTFLPARSTVSWSDILTRTSCNPNEVIE